MTIRTRILGLLAGSALMLSIASGAIAEEATVTLAENPNAKGCTLLSVTIPSMVGRWNGAVYTNPADGWSTTTLRFDSAFPGDIDTCDVSVWGTDFVGQSNNTNTFGINRLKIGGYTVSGDSGQPTLYLDGWPLNTNSPTTPIQSRVVLDLGGVTLPPDDYVSTLTFTIANHED